MFTKPINIFIANNSNIQAFGRGKYHFKLNGEEYVLSEVYWIPGLAANLFSVTTANEYGFDFRIDVKKKCAILSKHGKDVMIAKKEDESNVAIKLECQNEDHHTALMAGSEKDWHHRLAHAGKEVVKILRKHNLVDGLHLSTKEELKCKNCVSGRLCKAKHPTSCNKSKVKGILHIDTVGPITPSSLGKNKYFVLATEQTSGYKFIKFINDKTQVWEALQEIVNQYEIDTNTAVRIICTDQGTEYCNKEVRYWLIERNIVHNVSAAYVPQQNGTAENANR